MEAYNTFSSKLDPKTLLAGVYTQDARQGPYIMTPSNASTSGYNCVVFSKAKAFGVHTHMYFMPYFASDWAGKTLYLRWTRD